MALAESYYKSFCEYILREKPDIIGHFDLVTKFDELNPLYLENAEYKAMAKKYLLKALSSGSFFEVNTGAISRGYRHSPYPSADLLHTLKNNGGKLVITSDSHAADTLDCYFKETRQLLKEIGFRYVYTIYNGEFIKDYL
jgi:histidinol-phosphatase (PHP family)